MAPSPPTTPHPLFPVQQVNSSSSSTSSSSSWSRSLPPPTSCSAALRLQCPQSLSTWIKTSPHFHFHFFSTRPELRQLFILNYLLIFTFSIQPKLRSLSTFTFFNWSQDICSLSLSLFSNGVCQPQLYLGHTTTELFRSEIEKGQTSIRVDSSANFTFKRTEKLNAFIT